MPTSSWSDAKSNIDGKAIWQCIEHKLDIINQSASSVSRQHDSRKTVGLCSNEDSDLIPFFPSP